MKKAWFAAVPPLLALAACETPPLEVVCPRVLTPSVQVTALDSLTNVNVTPGATLVLQHSAGVDSVTVPTVPLTSAHVGEGRSGTFTLRVRRAGYRVWEKTGVQVEAEECGVKTVDVTARLEPIGPGPQ